MTLKEVLRKNGKASKVVHLDAFRPPFEIITIRCSFRVIILQLLYSPLQ